MGKAVFKYLYVSQYSRKHKKYEIQFFTFWGKEFPLKSPCAYLYYWQRKMMTVSPF